MDRRTNRSNKYQNLFVESPCSPEMLAEFAEAEGMTSRIASEHNEELLDLKDKLKDEFWRLVDEQLTPRQAEVLKLYSKGFTQTEIAKKLNVNQSSITKSINGNVDYKSGKKIYGGAKKKLKRLVDEDPRIQEILIRIQELQEDDF